jgi:hypothetical protein
MQKKHEGERDGQEVSNCPLDTRVVFLLELECSNG